MTSVWRDTFTALEKDEILLATVGEIPVDGTPPGAFPLSSPIFRLTLVLCQVPRFHPRTVSK